MNRISRSDASRRWAAERQSWREATREVARQELHSIRRDFEDILEYAPEVGILEVVPEVGRVSSRILASDHLGRAISRDGTPLYLESYRSVGTGALRESTYRAVPPEVRDALLEAERRTSISQGACASEIQARREYHSWLIDAAPVVCVGSPRSYVERGTPGEGARELGCTVPRDATPESPERLLAAGHPRVAGGRSVSPPITRDSIFDASS